MESDWLDEIIPRLQSSFIYKTFENKANSDPAGDHAKALIKDIVSFSHQKSKTVIRNLPEFTLHDADHLFRILHLMERILTKSVVENLYVPELLLLISSAFLHDIGMAPDEITIQTWKKYWDSEPKFSSLQEKETYLQFQRFCSARPSRTKDIDTLLGQGQMVLAETLKGYLITDYIRQTHGDRARQIIQEDWQGKIRYRDTDLTVDLAEICFGHTEDPIRIQNLEKHLLCGGDTYACLPVIAIALRIADILDFDLKRTPSVLFSHLAVRNPVSLLEWKKHRSIQAWDISQKLIKFHAKCSHPAIEAAIHKFCDLIDRELSTCSNILVEVNSFNREAGRDLPFSLPFQVDRTKIETQKDVFGKPLYQFRPTQFELSKNLVVDLLMGTKLYGDTNVALRELVQNSIDACLLRASMEAAWGNDYSPSIEIKYNKEGGQKILEVVDNGIGMDLEIIDNFYSKIGSSFYKSAEFYRLRAESGATFSPTSRFGIGILSCFMVADTLLLDTRKLYGPHNSSEPISLTIEGQDSIFIINSGVRTVPGTSTKLLLRAKTNPWEELSDEKFVLAAESLIANPPFPITVTTGSVQKRLDQKSFKKLVESSFKDLHWYPHENVKEVSIELDDPTEGILGSAIIGLLVSHGKPCDFLSLPDKEIVIENEPFKITKKLALKNNEIELSSTSITINDDGDIETEQATRSLAKSKSIIAFHGVEVATTLFPQSWMIQHNQANLSWPFPMHIVMDVFGSRDLDLNSARNRILLGSNWDLFEEDLARMVCTKLRKSLSRKLWNELLVIIRKTKNQNFLHGLKQSLNIIRTSGQD